MYLIMSVAEIKLNHVSWVKCKTNSYKYSTNFLCESLRSRSQVTELIGGALGFNFVVKEIH